MKTSKPTVLWVLDTRGWAFDLRMRRLKNKMPNYVHKTVYTEDFRKSSKKELTEKLNECDVVIMSSYNYGMISAVENPKKVITIMTSHRSMPNEKAAIVCK